MALKIGKTVRILQTLSHMVREEKFMFSYIRRKCWHTLFLGKMTLQLENGEKGLQMELWKYLVPSKDQLVGWELSSATLQTK